MIKQHIYHYYLSLFFSVILSNNVSGSHVLLFLEFTNLVFTFILFLYWIPYIAIFFLVISFSRYKEYMVYLISFSNFSNVLPAFVCERAIGNLWSVCLGVNIFNFFSCVSFIGNISLLKALRINSRLS